MQIDNLPANLLKILAGEGSSSLPQKFIQQLNLGQFLKGQVVRIFSEGKSLLNFQGQKIIVEGNSSFKVGQTLTARVEQLHPAPALKIIPPSTPAAHSHQKIAANDALGKALKQEVTIQLSSRTSSPVSFFSKTDMDYLQLSQQKVYRAEIKQVLNPETAVIQLKNRNFLAQTDGSKSLKPGDQIPLAVAKTENGSFQMLQSNGPVIRRVDPGMIKPYLSVRGPFGDMIRRLATVAGELSSGFDVAKLGAKDIIARLGETLRLLTPQTEKLPSAQMLKEQVDVSGINYETKVKQFLEKGFNLAKAGEPIRDLKGQLLEIILKLENQTAQKSFSSTQLQTLNNHVRVFQQAADNIELHQLTHQLAKQEGQSLLLQIPNPYGHGDATLKLYVRPSGEEDEAGEKGKGKQNFNLVFLLQLSALGNLRVDSQMKQNRLSIKMTVEDPSIADFISSQTGSFQSRLADLGFQADITCCVKEDINMDADNELQEILMKDEFRLVDVTT